MSQRYYAPWWNAKGVNNNECYADITASFEVAPDKGKKSALTAKLGEWSYVKLRAGTSGSVSLKLSIGYQRTDTVMIFGKPERAFPETPWPGAHPYHRGNLDLAFDLAYVCTEEGELTVELPTPVKRAAGTDLAVKSVFQKAPQKTTMYIYTGLDVPVEAPFWVELLTRDENQYNPTLTGEDLLRDASGETPSLLLPFLPVAFSAEGVRPLPKEFSYTVYFEVNSNRIDRIVKQPDGKLVDQGRGLDEWVKGLKRDDIWLRALTGGNVHLRGEARASATLNGKKPTELREHNQKLSEQRRKAVLDRINAQLSGIDSKQVSAIGMSNATLPGEAVQERRCWLTIDGEELLNEVKRLRQAKAGKKP